MKKFKIFTALVALILTFSACKKDLHLLNVDEKNATTAEGETFFSNAQKNLSDLLNQPSYGNNGPFRYGNLWVQHLSEITYTDPSNFFISGHQWSGMYQGVLKNLSESKKIITEAAASGAAAEAIKKNKLALIEIMEVQAYALLVESYGNVPYSEALNPDNVSPKYDDAQTIYKDLLSRLKQAITNLDASAAGFSQADLIYNGSISKWIKFANALRLKMGMRIIDVDAALGSQTVSEAINGGLISHNDENALFRYLNSTPNTNPLWILLVQGNRKDIVAAKTLVDQMNLWNDERRSVYFSQVNGQYVGTVYGIVTNYDLYSHMGTKFFEPTLAGILMDYASVSFLLAEAAERGIVYSPADAENHYNNAIKASFNYYGLDASNYLSQANVAYSTATGTWKEKIAMQKWIALYNQGTEAWTEYRRLDFPKLNASPNGFIDTVPVRLTYPVGEQTLNAEQYKKASTAIGGDILTTKLFWDKY